MKTTILQEASKIQAPIAAKKEYIHIHHNDTRSDSYHWMRLTDEQKNQSEPDHQTLNVIKHLQDENQYKLQVMKHLEPLKEKMYHEIIGRIKPTDMSVPYLKNGYMYITKYEEGLEYPIYSRIKKTDEILIDANERAKNHAFYDVQRINVSPDNNLLAFGEDTVGRRQYVIRFKNLITGEFFEESLDHTTGSVAWANDSKTLFYAKKNSSLRPYKIFRHVMGTPQEMDVEVYSENDETFYSTVFRSKSGSFILIYSYSATTQEFRYLSTDNPTDEFTLFHPRTRKLEYQIDHIHNSWYIRTNKDGAFNFKIMSTPLDKTESRNWTDLISHRKDVLVESLELFDDHLVLSERTLGNTQIRILRWDGSDDHIILLPEDAYTAFPYQNYECHSHVLRFQYTSMTTPVTTYDYDMNSKELTLMKRQEVLGNFDQTLYHSEKIFVPSRDGVAIPVSIVYRKGFEKKESSPLLLYGYGSYGHSMDPYFSFARLSLLDRGFVFAIAHIRGGEEMGRKWYEGGKLLYKKNTFNDFIDCGKYLKDRKYCADNKLFAMGGSAGGLLMGVIINEEPELWCGVVADVPFVDVISTMLDTSIPLTTGEFDEWGNPAFKEYYDYMKSYSPYDNIDSKPYPALFVTSGYHDSQVQYWEPTKWVAKIREYNPKRKPVLLHTNLEAGHGGVSGRFRQFRETAMVYAFLLDLAELAEVED